MAFIEAEKVEIRSFMGWAERFFQFDSELEQAISAIETKPAAEAKVRIHLAEFVRIDAAIVAAESRFKAKKVGSIELTMGDELMRLRSRGRQEVGRMASLFGVEPKHDVYAGYLPSRRASRWGQAGGGNYRMQG